MACAQCRCCRKWWVVCQRCCPRTMTGRGALNEGATSEEAREQGEVQKAFYSLLHALLHNALAGPLLQAGDGVVQPALNAAIQGAALHCDPGTRRSCVQVREFPQKTHQKFPENRNRNPQSSFADQRSSRTYEKQHQNCSLPNLCSLQT